MPDDCYQPLAEEESYDHVEDEGMAITHAEDCQ